MRATINGISLAYDDRGEGVPLILLHGFPLSRKIWEPQILHLEQSFRVIVPDLRGFGDSEAPAGPCTMNIYGDDIVALMDYLNITQAHLCGMSMGGYVLLNILDRYADRALSACFMVTRCGADDEAGKARRLILAQEALKSGAQMVADVFRSILFAPTTESENPKLVDEICRIMLHTAPSGLAGGLLAMRERKDYSESMGKFSLPALVIGGELDRAIPVDESRRLASLLPGATLEIIAGAGHMAGMERPEAVNRALTAFLKGI